MPRNQVVHGQGPVLPSAPSTDLEGVRTTTNAAQANAAATTTAAIFASPGEEITVVTREPNEKILVILNVERDNDNIAGTGAYRVRVDGVAAGPPARSSSNQLNVEGEVTVVAPITIAAAGSHQINAQVTSGAAGTESALVGATMAVYANEFG